MAHNGFEIAMLSLGRADSLLATKWVEGVPTRVLIDGGRKGHAATIRAFLQAHGVTSIDHVVCTHHDDDHAGGLVELIRGDDIQFGKRGCMFQSDTWIAGMRRSRCRKPRVPERHKSQ